MMPDNNKHLINLGIILITQSIPDIMIKNGNM